MNFHVGQRVVCVDDSNFIIVDSCTDPVAGVKYTIRDIFPRYGDVFVFLDEIRNPKQLITCGFDEPAFRASRFRPLVTRKTSIEIFERMLRPEKVSA